MKNNAESEIEANEHYHDRVANKYDQIYVGPRWDLWYELSWAPMKAHLPSDLRAPIVDLGCGTGKYGLRIAKSGFNVTLSDLSHGMLEVSRQKAATMGLEDRVSFVKADVMDLSALPREHFALAVAQGDVISFATHPPRALKSISKILRPKGVLVASLDQTLAAIDHYCEKSDLAGLEKLVKGGEMEWLARDEAERFPVHTYTPESLRAMFENAGFEVLDLFGKTVLPLKKLEPLMNDPANLERIHALEKKLCRIPSAMGRASHLQITARKKE
ncbi:MAG TPA: methyltransferase domain-containing protein [Planctomycetota bacterium]|nr:methyltransferase domain-containing protein [Planctomycetota bacterium]